jgi:transcriptional regulator with XRE-family HTH domain
MGSRALDQIAKPVAEDLARLGILIRDARAQRGFTQADLANRLGLSPTTVRASEKGDPGVAAGIVASLIWVLGIGPISASLAAMHPPVAQSKQRVRAGKKLDDF